MEVSPHHALGAITAGMEWSRKKEGKGKERREALEEKAPQQSQGCLLSTWQSPGLGRFLID